MKGRPLPFPLTVYFVLDISKAKYIVIAFCNALLINQASFSTLQQKSLILKTKYCQLPSWQIYCSTHYTAVGYRSCIKYSLSLNILYFLFNVSQNQLNVVKNIIFKVPVILKMKTLQCTWSVATCPFSQIANNAIPRHPNG